MKNVYAPGCALKIYKPELAQKVLAALNHELDWIEEHPICCRHEPLLPAGSLVINTCAGCDRRFRELYEGITTISLWEILAGSRIFPFPDYGGTKMAVLDACPTRSQERVHNAVRALLEKMNIIIAEPANTRTHGTCCGDSFYGKVPLDEVKRLMRKRAAEMPAEEVVVYCISCAKAMHIGGKKPRYLVDLLFGEATTAGTFEPDQWHAQLDSYIAEH